MAEELSPFPSLKPSGRSYAVPIVLLACVVLSVVMAVVKPVPHGHRYAFAVELSLGLFFIWMIYRVKPDWVLKKTFLAVLLAAGLAIGLSEFVTINPDAEIIHHYQNVFDDLRNGRNPYTSGLIIHRAEFLRPVYGNFNYPPLEILPYYTAYRLTGTWDVTIFLTTILILQAIGALIFLRTFPSLKRRQLWPFIPLFLFAEIHNSSGMTFLLTALILWAIQKEATRPRRGYRYAVAFFFGLGLMTKFLIIPLMAAFYWHELDLRLPKKILAAASEAGIALGTAALVMLPFGIGPVFRNTILFNIILKDRAASTTFFPNVLSGALSWVQAAWLYPILAVAILAVAVGVAPRLDRYTAMLTAVFAFLIVAPTPRNQFLPTVFYLAIVGILAKLEKRGNVSAGLPLGARL